MKLFLIRHAIAMEREDFDGADDLLRPLTDAGRKKAKRAFRGFERLYERPKLIVHSEALRARETAEILSRVTGAPLAESALLNPGTDYAAYLQLIRGDDYYGFAGSLALVGHEPDFSEILSGILAPPAGEKQKRPAFLHFDVKKASCIEVELHAPGSGELRNFLTPKVLRQLGRDS